MGFMGFQECMQYLIGYGLLISTFISDRHISIASHMNKVLHHIKHYFDIWHLKKKIRKSLTAISKLKGCEVLAQWIKPCERHLYRSATSTFSGCGRVIWAKFKSFLNHVVNKHSGFDEPLFNKCVHRNIPPRKWLKVGTLAYDKLVEMLTENSLVKGIKQASPLSQTRMLEGFHSALNYFAPKMIAYSYVGMYCRHILAAVHYNFNLHRETKKRNVDGEERIKVSYPKFKNGEATVRDVRVQPNFDYVEEIFQTYLNASKRDLTEAAGKLREMTPAPMKTMVEKQPREEAVQKRIKRRSMEVKDVSPTTPVSKVPDGSEKQKKKAALKCKQCKQPLKGHKNVVNCPKNRKEN